VAKKSTKIESSLKVDDIYGRLTKGQSRSRIVLDCSKAWGCSERQVDTYIARARERLLADCDMQRPALLAEMLSGIRDIRENAERRGQHQVALNAVRLMSELVGLTD
jgi:hypothetical protein